MAPKVSVFFIIDGPKLQAQAHLLICSMLDHLVGHCQIYAYHRQGAVFSQSLTRLIEKAGIILREIPGLTPDPWVTPYPIGNKLLAAADEREGEISVFLDTDTVLTTSIDFAAELGDSVVGAVLSDYRTAIKKTKGWHEIYRLMGVEMSPDRPGTLKHPEMDYPPYFNGGMVIFRNHIVGHRVSVGRRWLELSLAFEAQLPDPELHVNVDQITLSALGKSFGEFTKILPQRLNFNVMGWGVPDGRAADVIHYHILGRIWGRDEIAFPIIASLERHLEGGFEFFVAEYKKHLGARRITEARQRWLATQA